MPSLSLNYEEKPRLVHATQFDPTRPKNEWPEGVQEEDCYCMDLAQEGHRCPNHAKKTMNYVIDRIGHSKLRVSPGDWVVYYAGTRIRILPDDDFHDLFRPVK